eukprot:TRINITY_DN8997_c0_g1_i1.p1 TRINITY_DN8997_c0_g1~~TRINITY_DN8997_c0_g1_i1.p1  ORF type:complete len:149 (+),score=44.04 TRINITY_DN8997_c0_g1_i1:124-570(+)
MEDLEFLNQALTLQGELKKFSSKKLVGFQNRYWVIGDGGRLLAYYEKKPSLNDKPKDAFEITTIQNVRADPKEKKEFHFEMGGHHYRLKAPSAELRDKWVKALIVLKDYNLKTLKRGETQSPDKTGSCLLYTSPSPRDRQKSRMPSSA